MADQTGATRSAAPRRLIGAVLGIALGACATTPKPSLEGQLDALGYRIGDPVEQISSFRISGFNVLDNRHLILEAGPSRRYLIALSVRCSDLPYATRIAFTSTPSDMLTRLDKLVVDDRPGTQHCPIDAILRLEKRSTVATPG